MTLPEGTQVLRYPYVVAPGGIVPEGSSGTKASLYTQDTPLASWVITHSLGYSPSVAVIIDGKQVDADVAHPSVDQVIITFATPQAGTARLL